MVSSMDRLLQPGEPSARGCLLAIGGLLLLLVLLGGGLYAVFLLLKRAIA